MVWMAGISSEGRARLAAVTSGRRFVTPVEAGVVLGVSSTRAAQVLARWAEQGWLRRVRRGLYVPVPVDAVSPASWNEDALLIAAELWSPCLFTGWTAAREWGMTEQVFRTTVVKTAVRVRASDRLVAGYEFLLVRAAAEALAWGARSVWREERRLRFADPTRVVIDALDDPRLVGGVSMAAELLLVLLDDDPGAVGRLVEYGELGGNGSVFKRLGYLVERLRPDLVGLVAACAARLPRGVTLLDPTAPPDPGTRLPAWGLVVNVMVAAGAHA
jgi:predicted transcriptional regulator of viral defense system